MASGLEKLRPGIVSGGRPSQPDLCSPTLGNGLMDFFATRCLPPKSEPIIRFCGVDVVEESSIGDIVIVDVNFLPFCKHAPPVVLTCCMRDACRAVGRTK